MMSVYSQVSCLAVLGVLASLMRRLQGRLFPEMVWLQAAS